MFLFFNEQQEKKKDNCINLKSDRGAFRTCGFPLNRDWVQGSFLSNCLSRSLSGLLSANSTRRQ